MASRIPWAWLLRAVLMVGMAVWSATLGIAQDTPEAGRVRQTPRRAAVVEFDEMIDPLSGELLKRRFAQAVEDGAQVVVLDLHSPGGYTFTTFELMEMLRDAREVETIAWVDTDTFSGGALLALACDKIYIHPTASIGDAGEIVMGEDGAFRYTEAKSRSALAQKVRGTAADTGRSPALAEKLVHKDLVVFEAVDRQTGERVFVTDQQWDSMTPKQRAVYTKGPPLLEGGKNRFLTLSGQRAVEVGFADANADTLDEVLDDVNAKRPVPVYKRTATDTVIWLLNTNVVAFILIITGLVALIVEFSAPGISIGGIISIICFALFFWSRFLGGTAGWLEVTLFAVGLVCIAIEIFVAPGFGVPGLAGIGLIVGSLVMASRRGFTANVDGLVDLGWDTTTVVGAMLAMIVFLFIAAEYFQFLPGLSALSLKPPPLQTLSGDNVAPRGGQGFVAADEAPASERPLWQRLSVGDVAVTSSSLRPGGRIRVADEVTDATTDGDFVDADTVVRVVRIEGNRVVVRPDGSV